MNRPCPFCASPDTRPWQQRPEGTFRVCGACRSYLKDLDPEAFQRLHQTAFEDGAFIERIASGAGGPQPDHRTWTRFFGHLPPGDVLEIGPGTGHLLAAAMERGWKARGIETSPTHRAWIKATWGIETHAALMDLPGDYQADVIVLINVLEHVYDPAPLLSELGGRLRPGGRMFLSLPNAGCTVASWMGVWWSMFKQSDHVSIPTRAGLEALARRSGWTLDRIWSSELALETPVGLAVALRDRKRAGANPRNAGPTPEPALPPSTGHPSSLARRMHRIPPGLDPIAQLSGWFFRAGTLKAWLVRP
ncbi:MAG TPA: class I SAM-dependent methyltransferase [Holophagaceae bacterium]|nr:class I SAM-dependent methyltransferase [Holophagaceae bacterium]